MSTHQTHPNLNRHTRAALAVLCLLGILTFGYQAFNPADATPGGQLDLLGTDTTLSSVTNTEIGNTVNWVVGYGRDEPDPVSAVVTNPIPTASEYVPGSLEVPEEWTPEWSTDGGTTWVDTEPASGVTDIRMSHDNFSQIEGAPEQISAPLQGQLLTNSGGDGFNPIKVTMPNGERRIWMIYHQAIIPNLTGGYRQGDAGRDVRCFIEATGADCPELPGGAWLSSVPGPFNTGPNDMGSEWQPTYVVDHEFYGQILYPASKRVAQNNVDHGIGCLNYLTFETCGFWPVSTDLNVTSGGNTHNIAGYWLVDGNMWGMSANTGEMFCFNVASKTPCAGQPYAFPPNSPRFDGRVMTTGETDFELVGSAPWETRIYYASKHTVTNGNSNAHIAPRMLCWDTVTASPCAGYTPQPVGEPTAGRTGYNTGTVGGVFLEYDANRNAVGVCAPILMREHSGFLGATQRIFWRGGCFDLDTGARKYEAPFGHVWQGSAGTGIAAEFPDTGANHEATLYNLHTLNPYDRYSPIDETHRTYLPMMAPDTDINGMNCFDWTNQQMCQNINESGTKPGVSRFLNVSGGITATYGFGGDDTGCLYGLGHLGILWSFDEDSAEVPCRRLDTVTAASVASGPPTCAATEPTAWSTVRVVGFDNADVTDPKITLRDSDNQEIPGFVDVPLTFVGGVATVDISSVPMTGSTEQIEALFQGRFVNSTPFQGANPPQVILSYARDRVQMCFSTVTVGDCNLPGSAVVENTVTETTDDGTTVTTSNATHTLNVLDQDQCTSINKTGTDASTASTTVTSTGNSQNWTVTYTHHPAFSDGEPSSVVIADQIPTGTTYMTGTFETPAGWTPEWSVDGGVSWTGTEPGTGVTHIRMTNGAYDAENPPATNCAGTTGVAMCFSTMIAADDCDTVATTITNTATSLTSATLSETDSDSHSFNVTAGPGCVTDLTITKDNGETHVSPNKQFDYTITVTNNGPAASRDTIVTDTLPSSLTLNGPVTTDEGTCSNVGQAITCDLGTLPYPGTATITVPVVAGDPLTGPSITNTAEVCHPENGAPECVSDSDTDIIAGSVTGWVFDDDNSDGIQDPGEDGFAGVQVDLVAPGPDGLYGTPDDVIVGSTTTGPGGVYRFDDVPPGTYAVWFDDGGGTLSPKDQGSDDTLDSDPNPGTGFTDPFPVVAGETVDNVDAGLTLADTTITGVVWADTNNNGIQDNLNGAGGEPGVSGVTVHLMSDGGDGIFGNGNDLIVGTTTTDPDGTYEFTGVPTGLDYQVHVVPPGDSTFTDQHVGGDPNIDSDVHQTTGLTDPFTTGASNVYEAGLVPNFNPDDDAIITPQGVPVTFNVVDNDQIDGRDDGDPIPDEFTILRPTSPVWGPVDCDVNTGTCTWTPTDHYVGDDTFTYTLVSETWGPFNLTVDLESLYVNDAPIIRPDFGRTGYETAITFNPLDNDEDPNDPTSSWNPTGPNRPGDPLTLISNTGLSDPSAGTVSCAANGQCTFTPAAGYTGTVTFDYTAADTGTSDPRVDDPGVPGGYLPVLPLSATGTVNLFVDTDPNVKPGFTGSHGDIPATGTGSFDDIGSTPTVTPACAAGQPQVTVDWTESSPKATRYRIERSTPGDPAGWVLIDTVNAPGPYTLVDQTVADGTTYEYRVIPELYRWNGQAGPTSAGANVPRTDSPDACVP